MQRFYGALGLGFPAEALRLFDREETESESREDDAPDGGGHWCLRRLGHNVRCVTTSDLSSREFFYLPHDWEVIRVVAHSLSARRKKRGEQITALGEMYCRPRGTWENIRIPFQHVWTLCGGRALLFENLLDATDLTREGSGAVCPV